MSLDELERAAREATRGSQSLSWWTSQSLRYHLRVADGTCPECDPPFIAACNPAEILRLVAIARAAEKALSTMDEAMHYVSSGAFWSPGAGGDKSRAIAALRQALDAGRASIEGAEK